MTKSITVQLSRDEVSILLGARLMYLGVPFSRKEKRLLTESENQRIDAFREILLEQRELTQEDTASIIVDSKALADYVDMLRACLEECNGNPVDLSIHLRTRSEAAAETLINKLVTVSQQA